MAELSQLEIPAGDNELPAELYARYYEQMSIDNLRHEAARSADVPRLVGTSGDTDYSLSIEQALTRYEAAGLARSTRSIQHYCAKGDLDCHRVETPFGIKFFITPASVDRHIAYIKEVRLVATSRGMSRQMSPVKIRRKR